MIIDDDQQVHAVTHMVFRDFTYEDRGVEFLDGFSGEEAKQLIQENPDTAVLFLDVVMETDSAGLDLVRYIRNELGNKLIRIILRTGQPGEAPEARVTNDYDINDYRDKTNLDHQQMETLLLTSLRSYQQMRFIEQQLESEEVIGSLLRLSLAEMPLTEMLQQVINKLLAVNWHGLEAKGGIYLNTGKELVLAAHKGLPVFLLENCSRIPFGHCPCGLAAESGKPVVCSTVDQHHDVMCPGIQPLGHYCAPIRRGNDILGVLYLYTPEGYVLDEHENRFMEQLNNTLAGIVYRKQAEQSLAASEARYRSITQSATDAIISADSQGRLFSWNSGAEKMFGYSEQEVLGEDIVRLVPEQYLDQHTNSFRRRCQEDGKGLKQCAYEVAALKKDGQQIPVEIVLSHWSTSDNIYYTAIVRDITARKRVTRELDDLRNKLANIIDSMPSLLIGVDREGRINQWNLEARNSTGLTIEQVEGRPFPEIFPELKIDSAQISRAVRERREQKQQKLTWRKDNQDRYADITIYPLLTDSSEGAV
ncbi:MAG: PAS domain S-box protein, partial [Gammaproteobacteria bacterium]|nr:PAS domain S-box protein [Gammaproteobacteria bacterium]